MISTGILFGLFAMIGWGISDFLAAKAVRKVNVFRTFLWSQGIGLILFFIIFSLFFEFPKLSFFNIALILISGLIIVISGSAFYKGLQVGYVSIVSSIASSSAAITVILSLIFLKEVLTGLQVAGVSLAILGAILTSFKLHDLVKLKFKNMAVGVEYALIAMVGWGVMMIFITMLVSELGWFLPIFLIKASVVFFTLIYLIITRKDISFPKNITKILIPSGLLESAAFLALGVGISLEYTSIVAPIASAFPVIAIILARIFFKEILELTQKIGVVTVICGLVLLSI